MLQTLALSSLARGLKMPTHLDKIYQIGLKPALVEKHWLACLHRDLQTWSSCWVELLPITRT